MTMEASSPEVIKLKFAGPNGMALRMLAFHGNQWPLNFERFGFYAPKHYLTQYHPKLNNNANDYKVFADKAIFVNGQSPDAGAANNLFSFLAMRANQSFTNLGCNGNNPIVLTMKNNIVVDAKFVAGGAKQAAQANQAPAQQAPAQQPAKKKHHHKHEHHKHHHKDHCGGHKKHHSGHLPPPPGAPVV